MSLQHSDAEAAAVATAPRVSLADIHDAIAARYDFTASQALEALGHVPGVQLSVLSICLLQMKNGFTVVGKSAPASPQNFDPDFGRQLAYEDAVRQLWPLMGYALCDKLANGGLHEA